MKTRETYSGFWVVVNIGIMYRILSLSYVSLLPAWDSLSFAYTSLELLAKAENCSWH
jgi:hypothetical protein